MITVAGESRRFILPGRRRIAEALEDPAAFIELEENTPPSDGTVGSVPLSGTALDTVFTMSAAAWVDDEEPLAYRFMARVKGDTRWTQLKDFSPVPEFVGTLPGGDADGKVEVAVEVKDSLGAVSAAKVIEVTSTSRPRG